MTRAAPRDHAAGGSVRRYLSILFADLSGSTQLANTLEAEEYGEILAALRTLYESVIARHGGAVAQISGDGVLAIFGHAGSREDDTVRAVEAALELHAAAAALDGPWRRHGVALRLHSGVHSGLVLLRQGDQLGGRFELPGAATNIAARLCDAAAAGEIMVSDASLGPERHRFAFERRAIRVQGRKTPVPALRVTGRTEVQTRYAASIRNGLTPFVGRQPERARLAAALERAMAGSVAVLALSGPPGVGKTRLADEFVRGAMAQGFEILRGECESGGAALQPFRQIARQAAALLPTAPDPIDQAIVAAAHHARAILFIDDWHLADDASRELLAKLAAAPGLGLLILLTVRTPAPPVAAELLDLAPLDRRDVDAVVQALVPAANPVLRASVREASGGNPLYIEELCRSIDGGRFEAQPTPSSAWIDTLIESRFARLQEDAAELLRTAAAIGTVVPTPLLARVAAHPPDDRILQALAEQDFLFAGEQPDTLRFKHGITREAIYRTIGLGARRALHLRIAESLRALAADRGEEEPVEALALHYGQGDDAAATAEYAERAGDRALALSALDRAQGHYHAALAALDCLPDTAENAIRWSRIAQRYGRSGVFDPSHEQLAVFQRAIERADARGDRAARAWALYWLGFIHYGLGDARQAIAHAERALTAALKTQDQIFAGQVRALLGQAHAAASAYPQALPLLDAAIGASSAGSRGRPSAALAYTRSCKAFALADLGRFDEAYAVFDDAMASARGSMREIEVSVLTQRAAACLWHYRFAEALALADSGASISELIGSRYSLAMSRAMQAYARWSLDPAFDPVPVLADSVGWLANNGRNQFLSLVHGWLAQVSAVTGDVPATRHHAAGALWRAARNDHFGEAMALRALAMIAARGGTRHPPQRYLDRAEAVAEAAGRLHETAVTRLLRVTLMPAASRAPDSLAAAQAGLQALGMAPQASVALSAAS